MKYATAIVSAPPARATSRALSGGGAAARRSGTAPQRAARAPKPAALEGARILSPSCYSVSIVSAGGGYAGW